MEARFEGKSFWEIDEDKHRFVTDEIILTIASIYGSRMPETEIMASYVSREIVSLITDFGYDDLTVAEIILALRLNYQLKISNKYGGYFDYVLAADVVCSDFLSQILANYKILRTSLDNLVERKIMGY